jgi:hypothetical protein
MLASMAAVVVLWPLSAFAQDGRATLENAAKALGGANLKSIEYTATGANFAVGQSPAPGAPWPRFNLKSYTRSVNYDTASHREDLVRSRADTPARGGGAPATGEARQILVVSGDHAWNVTGETAAPAPVALIERQLQLWATPHGVIKAAAANNAIQGRIDRLAVPALQVRATLASQNLVEKASSRARTQWWRQHRGDDSPSDFGGAVR